MEGGRAGEDRRGRRHTRRPPRRAEGEPRRQPPHRLHVGRRAVHLRRPARRRRCLAHPALPAPRDREERPDDLPDGLFEDKRVGRRTHGGPALHARSSGRHRPARHPARGGNAPRRGRDLQAREERDHRGARDAYGIYLGETEHDSEHPAEVGAHHCRRDDLRPHAGEPVLHGRHPRGQQRRLKRRAGGETVVSLRRGA